MPCAQSWIKPGAKMATCLPRCGHNIGVGTLPVTESSRRFAVTDARIVAVGLLTQRDLELLGQSFDRLWPVNETPCFGSLLQAIDEADRDLWRERDEEKHSVATIA